jgi:hypothetical protein
VSFLGALQSARHFAELTRGKLPVFGAHTVKILGSGLVGARTSGNVAADGTTSALRRTSAVPQIVVG